MTTPTSIRTSEAVRDDPVTDGRAASTSGVRDDASRAAGELPTRVGRRHHTWLRVLGAGLLCFAVWLLLDAPTLLRSAQGSPLGTRRSVAIAVLRPMSDVSRAIGLSHVVGAADRVLGRVGGAGVVKVVGPAPSPRRPPAGSHPRTQGAGSSSAPGLRVTPRGVPPGTASDGLAPLPTPSAAEPLRLLVVGDSIGTDFGEALVNDLGSTGVVDAVLDGRIDTGLSRPDYFDWPAELADDLARYRPQVVVVCLGANDPQNFVDHGQVLSYGTPAWTTAYAGRVGAFMQAATDAGARVLWVGMPPMADPTLDTQMQALDTVYQTQAQAHWGVSFLSSWPVLSGPQSQYSEYLPDASGAEVDVRTPDGTHLSPAGAERLSQAALAAMDRDWGLDL